MEAMAALYAASSSMELLPAGRSPLTATGMRGKTVINHVPKSCVGEDLAAQVSALAMHSHQGTPLHQVLSGSGPPDQGREGAAAGQCMAKFPGSIWGAPAHHPC